MASSAVYVIVNKLGWQNGLELSCKNIASALERASRKKNGLSVYLSEESAAPLQEDEFVLCIKLPKTYIDDDATESRNPYITVRIQNNDKITIEDEEFNRFVAALKRYPAWNVNTDITTPFIRRHAWTIGTPSAGFVGAGLLAAGLLFLFPPAGLGVFAAVGITVGAGAAGGLIGLVAGAYLDAGGNQPEPSHWARASYAMWPAPETPLSDSTETFTASTDPYTVSTERGAGPFFSLSEAENGRGVTAQQTADLHSPPPAPGQT